MSFIINELCVNFTGLAHILNINIIWHNNKAGMRIFMMLKKFFFILAVGFILMWLILNSPLFSEDSEFSTNWEKATVNSMR